MATTAGKNGRDGRIVVYGASGFTGKLIAAELTRRGADITLAGRNREKLDAVAAGLDGDPAVAAVPLDDAAGLRELVGGAAAVIGCAGPFTLHGRPLIAAAAETGTNYLDTTGEQPFIRDSFERWGEAAATSGAALVSGFGFDYTPGDMLASLTAEGLGRLRRMTVAYMIRGFEPTRGTALSALEMIKGGDVEWRDGGLRPAPRHVGAGSFAFPSPIGARRVGRYPAGEAITVPRHVDVDSMDVVIDMRSLMGVSLGPLSAPAMTAGGLLMATPARKGVAKLIGRLPEGPSERGREAVRYTIVCDVEHEGGRRRGVLRGPDVYGITAVILSEGAMRMADPGYDRAGALAPAQAFDPEAFLACLEPFGVSVEVGGGGLTVAAVLEEAPYPCPACGATLYGWTAAHDPLDRGKRIVLDRCESCGLSVTRGPSTPDADAEIEPLLNDEGDGRVTLTAPNRRSIQGSLGGAQWAGLEPELRRLHLNPESVRRLLAKRGLEVDEVKTPLSRDSRRLMVQTLLNAFTYRDNFLRNARAGRVPRSTTGERWLYRLDWVVSVLVYVPCALFGVPLEAVAAATGRGGVMTVEAHRTQPGSDPL